MKAETNLDSMTSGVQAGRKPRGREKTQVKVGDFSEGAK